MTANTKATLATVGLIVAFITLFFIPIVLKVLVTLIVGGLLLLIIVMGVRELWCAFRRVFEEPIRFKDDEPKSL